MLMQIMSQRLPVLPTAQVETSIPQDAESLSLVHRHTYNCCSPLSVWGWLAGFYFPEVCEQPDAHSLLISGEVDVLRALVQGWCVPHDS